MVTLYNSFPIRLVNRYQCLSGKGDNLNGVLFVRCFVLFQHVFNYITVASAPIHAFLEFFFTSTLHNILSKLLLAFPHCHRRSNGQEWEENGSYSNDYHQSSERLLAEPGLNRRPPVLKFCVLPTELHY